MINVNLLPPELKHEIAQAKENTKAVKYLWYIIFIFLAVVLITGGLWYYFSNASSTQEATLKSQESSLDQYGNLELKAKKLAERLTAIKSINAKTNQWSDTITEIQKVMPSGVYLVSVRIDSSGKVRNQISGVAVSKQQVAALRDAMEKSDKFEYVDIESSNTTEGKTTGSQVEDFSISFALSKGALE